MRGVAMHDFHSPLTKIRGFHHVTLHANVVLAKIEVGIVLRKLETYV